MNFRSAARVLAACAVLVIPAVAAADEYGPPVEPITTVRSGERMPTPAILSADGDTLTGGSFNPLEVLGNAAGMVPGGDDRADSDGPKGGLAPVLNVMLLLTVITLAPAILLMTTCFVRIIIVLGMLRQAVGTQTIPPPQVITGLALFMTAVVMAPTVERIYQEAVVPYREGTVRDYGTLWAAARQPMRDFMFAQIEATGNWSGVYMMLNYRGIDTSRPENLTRADVDMVSLIPAYMLSELRTAFMMGFRVYLPFLVIDMVISSLLISMSMMMLPPVLISLPFKLLLFVMVDGWQLVVGSLLTSFARPGPSSEVAAGVFTAASSWFT